MPEVCEVAVTVNYLNTKAKNKILNKVQVISGRYTRHKLAGIININSKLPLVITKIDSKGKFMWMEFTDTKTNDIYYMVNTYGLSGGWGFNEHVHNRVKFILNKDDKEFNLYFHDMLNYGTMKFFKDKKELDNKLNSIGKDLLKNDFTDKQWYDDFIEFRDKKQNGKKLIVDVMMNQTKNGGIGSGLGNYLAPEILYSAKISPHRQLKDFSDNDIKILGQKVRYILRLAYCRNDIGYMTHFKTFIPKMQQRILDGTYPNFHKNENIGDEKFDFVIYQKKKDPFGNTVIAEKILKGRNTYWVPSIQI